MRQTDVGMKPNLVPDTSVQQPHISERMFQDDAGLWLHISFNSAPTLHMGTELPEK
jgi:hypothetical protein